MADTTSAGTFVIYRHLTASGPEYRWRFRERLFREHGFSTLLLRTFGDRVIGPCARGGGWSG